MAALTKEPVEHPISSSLPEDLNRRKKAISRLDLVGEKANRIMASVVQYSCPSRR